MNFESNSTGGIFLKSKQTVTCDEEKKVMTLFDSKYARTRLAARSANCTYV